MYGANSMLRSDYLSVLLLRVNISHSFMVCLYSSSVCSVPFGIFCSNGLAVKYCFSFCLSWKTFIPISTSKDSFVGGGS
jgi:hypothetical protein